MEMTMTKRDKALLYVVLVFAFLVLYIRFLLIPGIENHSDAAADLTEAQDAQAAMQDTILMAAVNASDKNTAWGELQTANATFYSLLSSDALDTLVTSLELNHNLQPDTLTIGDPVPQALTAYVASENAGSAAAPGAADALTTDATDGNAILASILAADLTPGYDLAGYYKTAALNFTCSGSNDDFLALLDDLASAYPAVQLRSFSMTDRAVAGVDGTAVSSTIFTVSLNVVLCDKEGVQP